jgi:hypothetical protein
MQLKAATLVQIAVLAALTGLLAWHTISWHNDGTHAKFYDNIAETVWDKLDDVTPDDSASEVRSKNDPSDDTLEVDLSEVDDPESSSGHIVRYAVAKSGAKTTTVDVSLLQKDEPVAADSQRTLTDSYETFSFTLTADQADAITDYSELRVHLTATAGGSGDQTRALATWIELEVPEPAATSTSAPTEVQFARPTSDENTGGWAAGTTSLWDITKAVGYYVGLMVACGLLLGTLAERATELGGYKVEKIDHFEGGEDSPPKD